MLSTCYLLDMYHPRYYAWITSSATLTNSVKGFLQLESYTRFILFHSTSSDGLARTNLKFLVGYFVSNYLLFCVIIFWANHCSNPIFKISAEKSSPSNNEKTWPSVLKFFVLDFGIRSRVKFRFAYRRRAPAAACCAENLVFLPNVVQVVSSGSLAASQ